MSGTITIKYTCHLCGIYRVELPVPAREEENVVDWVNASVQLVANDHRRRSPQCSATTLDEFMIPVTGEKVGGPTQH